MNKPSLVCLLLLAATPALAEEGGAAAGPIAMPAALPAASHAPAAALTVARVNRHVTRTITALMRRLAESRIPPETRSELNRRLLDVQAEASSAAQAGQPPAGEDVERFSARLGKALDSIAGTIDSASARVARPQ